jgi:hypothetical protein
VKETIPARLIYAYRPFDTKKWFFLALTTGRATTGLALDSKGNPNIVYELADGQLWFTSFNGSKWQQPTQIAPGYGIIGYSCTVVVDGSGRPHLFWYQTTHGNTDFYHLRHAELINDQWRASTLDEARETGKWHSTIADPNGGIYVVYSAFPDEQLKLAHFDGKEWSYEVVDQPPPGKASAIHPIFGGSIALDKNGAPLISYEDENRVKLARKVDGKWKQEEVDPILPFGNREKWWELKTSIAVDHSGMIHIVYTDAGSVKHAYQEDGKWHVETLVGSGADSSRFPEIAVGKDGYLYVVYRDPDDGALMFATGRPFEASPAATETASAGPGASSNAADADFANLGTDKRLLLEEYRKSADQGSTAALKFLGTSYLIGKDVPKDPAKAAAWYRKAADEGDAGAQTALGWMYLHGLGVPQDDGEALRCIQLATQRNFAPAQELLGYMYSHARGLAHNDEEAVKWFKLAADQGNAMGQLQLALAYSLGTGITRDESQAVAWLKKSAEQGMPSAETILGLLYRSGGDVPHDDAEAVRWFQKAAAQGYAPAEGYLGCMLLHGMGSEKNAADGIAWLQKGAAQGEPHSQYALGDAYRLGMGVKRDPAMAKEFYCATAEAGLPEGMAGCGYLLFNGGPGVKTDLVESIKWLALAVVHNQQGAIHDVAVSSLSQARAKATPAQLAEATRRADSFTPHIPALNPAAGSAQPGGK